MMTPAQRKDFIGHLQAVALVFKRRLPDAAAAVYADAMPEDVDFDRLIAALDRMARTAEQGVAWPVPRVLADLARGSWHQPSRKLTDLEADRIHQAVYAEMAVWEREDGHGSARPVFFERAWRRAVLAEGVKLTPQLTEARDATWQQWLTRGLPLTRQRLVNILADAAPHGSPTFLREMCTLVEKIERGDEADAPPVRTTLATVVQAVLDREEPSTPKNPEPPPEPEPPPPLAAEPPHAPPEGDTPTGPTWEEF
jgi:hypothetical protein